MKVVPGSSRDQVVGWLGDASKIKVTAPPEKGKANEAVIELLAEPLGVGTDAIDAAPNLVPAGLLALHGLHRQRYLLVRRFREAEEGAVNPPANLNATPP